MRHPQETALSWLDGITIPGAPDWLSGPVIACGASALGLLVLSLLLRGLQKVISIALVIALLLGCAWFLRDAWRNKDRFLSPKVVAQLDSVADSILKSPQAQAAWQSAKDKVSQFFESSSTTESKGKPSEEASKKAMDSELAARSRQLKQAGHAKAAEEITKLREHLKRESGGNR